MCHVWKGQHWSSIFFSLHMNHRHQIKLNICIAILICTIIYEGSQNTCNPQKTSSCRLVLLPAHVANEPQRLHSWNFPNYKLAGAEKGHLSLWVSSLSGTGLYYQACSHISVRGTSVLHLWQISTPFGELRFCAASKQKLQKIEHWLH